MNGTIFVSLFFFMLPVTIFSAPVKYPELKEVCSHWYSVVVMGDTCYEVAEKCGTSVSEIYSNNDMLKSDSDCRHLQINQKLCCNYKLDLVWDYN